MQHRADGEQATHRPAYRRNGQGRQHGAVGQRFGLALQGRVATQVAGALDHAASDSCSLRLCAGVPDFEFDSAGQHLASSEHFVAKGFTHWSPRPAHGGFCDQRTAGDHPAIGGNRRRGINADMVSRLQGPSGDLGIDLVRANQPRVSRDGQAFLQQGPAFLGNDCIGTPRPVAERPFHQGMGDDLSCGYRTA